MDDCAGCQALRAEYLNDVGVLEPYWEEQMLWTAAQLPIRGWAGGFSDGERAYLHAHPPFWYARAIARGAPNQRAQTQTEQVDAEDDAGAIA